MSYTLDANILINLENRYPRDVFPTLWELIAQAASNNEVCICRMVRDELTRGRGDLTSWLAGIADFVCDPTDAELKIVHDIACAHQGWVRETKNEADPHIIAHAKTDGLILVTEEKRKGRNVSDKNQSIPNVADEYGVRCIGFFEFLRIQKWSF